MDQVGQNRTGLDVTAPWRGVIFVILACCPLAGHRHQPADAPALDDLARGHRAGIVTPLMADQNPASLLRGVARHLVCLLHGGGDRLFDKHRLAMAEGRHHIGMMTLGRGGDNHRLDIRLHQHAVGVGKDRNAAGLAKRRRHRRRVGNRDKIDMRHLVDGLHVAPPDRAGTDQSNSENIHLVFTIFHSRNRSPLITDGGVSMRGANPIRSRTSLWRSTPGAISTRCTPSSRNSKTARSVT